MIAAKPVTIHGVEYPSHNAASRATGIPRRTIAGAVLNGHEEALGNHSAVLRIEIDRLRAALRDTTENGLIYWEPRTARGAAAQAEMIARNKALYE